MLSGFFFFCELLDHILLTILLLDYLTFSYWCDSMNVNSLSYMLQIFSPNQFPFRFVMVFFIRSTELFFLVTAFVTFFPI